MDPRLASRLTIPMACVSGLLLVIAVGAAVYVRAMQQSLVAAMATNVTSMQAAQELEISIREVRTQFDRYLITGDKRHLEPVGRQKRRTAEALEAADAAAVTPAEDALMRRVQAGYDHFFAEYEAAVREPAGPALYPKLVELTDAVLTRDILEPAHEYLRLNEGMLTKASEANQAQADRLTVGLLGVGLSGSAGGLLAGYAIAASLRRSLRRTEDRLRDAADILRRAVPGGEADAPAGSAADPIDRVTAAAAAVLDRLEQSERDALQAERLAWVGQMAAGLGHEVRNPLMAIKLLVQAAAARRPGVGFKPRDLEVLHEEIVRLEHIVSGFLDFARPPRPVPQLVDLGELVGRTADAVRGRADLQSVGLTVRLPPAPVVAPVDPGQIRQVVYNLLLNALDAQPEGGEVTVGLAAERSSGGRQAVVLTVEDAGPGLPANLGDRIFEPFISTKDAGMGLGLSICRRIVESHGGTLRAADRLIGGAAFTARVPLPAGRPAVGTNGAHREQTGGR